MRCDTLKLKLCYVCIVEHIPLLFYSIEIPAREKHCHYFFENVGGHSSRYIAVLHV